MKKTMTVMTMVIALALSTMAAASPGGAASKATGDGYWTATASGNEFYAAFNAHEAKENRPAKGALYQTLVDGTGSFEVKVTDVIVGDDYACFWGPTENATGTYEQFDGQNRWTYVTAGDGPGSGTFRGTWSTTPDRCKNGTVSDDFWFTGGNITIHSGKAHE